MRRRQFIATTAAAFVQGAPSSQPQTYIYKKADGCEIKLDVFGVPSSGLKPVAIWIHGGALILGARKKSPDLPLVSALLEVGFSVVSIDYRLAPETKLPGILEDVRDAFHWIRANAPRLLLGLWRYRGSLDFSSGSVLPASS